MASLGVAGCAIEITGDRRAGAVAALALALTPLASLAFGSASPDGPYLMFWALALWFGARAFRRDELGSWALLGVALAGVLLSRVLGLALLFGVIAYACTPSVRHVWRRGLPLALGIALVLCVPFLVWNARHDWVTLTFAIVYRHEEVHRFSLTRVRDLLLTQAAAYSPGIFLAVLLLAVRPRNAFLAWAETAAARYFIKAAGHNNPVAQDRAARLYVSGRGVKKNVIEGMKWHMLSRAAGLQDAWLDGEMNKLTRDERAARRARRAALRRQLTARACGRRRSRRTS